MRQGEYTLLELFYLSSCKVHANGNVILGYLTSALTEFSVSEIKNSNLRKQTMSSDVKGLRGTSLIKSKVPGHDSQFPLRSWQPRPSVQAPPTAEANGKCLSPGGTQRGAAVPQGRAGRGTETRRNRGAGSLWAGDLENSSPALKSLP